MYTKIIETILQKYGNSLIHIFSWDNPGLEISSKRIVCHTATDGLVFLDDFNALVHADILIVGSSTFSICAGLFNKNKVLCSKDVCKLITPIPLQWIKNYKEILC